VLQLSVACALWDRKNEDLPEDRKVKVIIFPVRVLEFEDVTCTQKLENISISGTVNNISPVPLVNLRIEMEVFLAGDDEPRETFLITGAPSPFEPDMATDFHYSEFVERPVAFVQLHAYWGDTAEER
jgi:hypothetical protein